MWITDFIADTGIRPASWADLTGCRTSTVVYTPNIDTSLAKPGDLAVVIIRRNNDQITPAVTIPAGWSRFLASRHQGARGFGRALVDVVYKFLTADDIATGHTFVHGAGVSATNDLCAAAFIFPDAHPDIPLDGLQWEWQNPITNSPYIMRWAGLMPMCIAPEGYYTFNIIGYGGPSGESNFVEVSDAVQIPSPSDALYAEYRELLTYHTYITLRTASAGVQNLFTNENWRSIMTDWTPVNLGTFLHGVTTFSSGELSYARLVPNTTLGRHYAYQDVVLEAGKWYTYTAKFHPYGSGYSPYNMPAFGVVPPSGEANEFGAACTGYGQSMVLDDTQAAYNDPQGGRTVWWWAAAHYGEPDGLPNGMQGEVSLLFQAQESGVHQLRMYVHNSNLYENVWANIVHASSSPQVYITQIALVEGVALRTWLPSNPGPVMSMYQPAPALYTKFAGTSTCGHLKFWVNPKGPLPPAIMHASFKDGMGEIADQNYGLVYESGDVAALGNDVGGNPLSSLRLIYPSFSGVKRKYYAEMYVTATSGSPGFYQGIFVNPLYPPNADTEANYGGDGYGWMFNGSWIIPQTNTFTQLTGINASPASPANPTFGVVVDYPNSNVRFYKNGTIHAVIDMRSTAGADNATLPFRIFMAGGPGAFGAGRIYFNARLGGGFSHQPIGTAPWDIANGTIPTPPAMSPEGIVVTKSADETRTDSTPTFAASADSELSYTLEANKKYFVQFAIRLQGAAAAGWKGIVNYTGSGSYQLLAHPSSQASANPTVTYNGRVEGASSQLWSGDSETAVTQTTTAQLACTFSAAPADRGLVLQSGYIQTGGSGGTIRLLWKPNATNATGATVLAGSVLRIEECT